MAMRVGKQQDFLHFAKNMLKTNGRIYVGKDSIIFTGLKVIHSIEIFRPIFLFRQGVSWLAEPAQCHYRARGFGKSTVHIVA